MNSVCYKITTILFKLFPKEVSSNQKCWFYAAFRLIYFIKCYSFHIVFKNFSSKLVAIIQYCFYEIHCRYNLLLLLKTNNNLIYPLGMYKPDTDSIVVYANDSKPFIINCQKCNSSVILDNPDDIVYLFTGLHKMLLCCMQNLLSKQMVCKDMLMLWMNSINPT